MGDVETVLLRERLLHQNDLLMLITILLVLPKAVTSTVVNIIIWRQESCVSWDLAFFIISVVLLAVILVQLMLYAYKSIRHSCLYYGRKPECCYDTDGWRCQLDCCCCYPELNKVDSNPFWTYDSHYILLGPQAFFIAVLTSLLVVVDFAQFGVFYSQSSQCSSVYGLVTSLDMAAGVVVFMVVLWWLLKGIILLFTSPPHDLPLKTKCSCDTCLGCSFWPDCWADTKYLSALLWASILCWKATGKLAQLRDARIDELVGGS